LIFENILREDEKLIFQTSKLKLKMVSLKTYQRNAVDQLKECTQKLLKSTSADEKFCIFQAPTGSGKTVMAAIYIEEMLRTSEGENLCFLWLSTGKASLQVQSKRSLSNIFQEFPKVTLYEEEYHGSKDSLDNQSVTVVNWEKLNNKPDKGKDKGVWTNRLMKDAEYFNFREVLPNTKAKGLKIIGIIDESHIGAGAIRTTELREIIDADVWIEVSATPKTYDNIKLKEIIEGNDSPKDINRNTWLVYVKSDDVIKEEMIKKTVIVNESMNNFDVNSEDSQTLVLHAAFDKRLMLRELYKDEGTKINPLVLIQIENANAGNTTMEYVQRYLAEKEVDADNIAVWLSGDKSESIKYISDSDNHIEFLIFKQAIDTGWDCPRAQILVKFRETQSEIFATQVLGRILRMPEQKHYKTEDLNIAYIFTNLNKFDEDKTGIPNLIKTLVSNRKDTYESLNLSSFYKKRVDYGDLTELFYEVLEKAFCEHFGLKFRPTVKMFAENEAKLLSQGLDLSSVQRLDMILDNLKIGISDIDDTEKIKTLAKDKNIEVKKAEHQLQSALNAFLSHCLSGHYAKVRSLPTLRTALYHWFKEYLGINPFVGSKVAIHIQAILLKIENNETFSVAIDKALQAFKPVKKAETKERSKQDELINPNWEIPQEEYFSEKNDESLNYSNYAHNFCYLDKNRSQPERNFELFLANKGKDEILWWWKNKNFGQTYFGIRYEDASGVHTFYPDFLIQFTDGKIGIFDTKQGNTAESAKERAEALQAYISSENAEGKNLIGGILVQKNDHWLLNQNTEYDYHKKEDWKYLDDFWKTI
jgi:type III restriction enzyme